MFRVANRYLCRNFERGCRGFSILSIRRDNRYDKPNQSSDTSLSFPLDFAPPSIFYFLAHLSAKKAHFILIENQ